MRLRDVEMIKIEKKVICFFPGTYGGGAGGGIPMKFIRKIKWIFSIMIEGLFFIYLLEFLIEIGHVGDFFI